MEGEGELSVAELKARSYLVEIGISEWSVIFPFKF
jgi:hypothetical protein